MAQQVTGTLGSAGATTTVDGKQLPAPPPKFGGVIKESAKDSTPWWPPRVVTPFKWTKQVASHFGGTRQGLAISWPGHIKDLGAIRMQFHHVIDIVPTILEAAGVQAPVTVNGIAQRPIEGVSMAYTFDQGNANAPSTRTTQYFEMASNGAIYHDGWIAATTPFAPPLGFGNWHVARRHRLRGGSKSHSDRVLPGVPRLECPGHPRPDRRQQIPIRFG
jgi:arylsulfatase